MTVEKKILPEYFELILSGKKTYDFRLADFEINPGDALVLREWDKDKKDYTGRKIEKIVTYVGKTKGDTTWSQEDIDRFGYQIIAMK
jgi:ASC-1-like (ASCH) protein